MVVLRPRLVACSFSTPWSNPTATTRPATCVDNWGAGGWADFMGDNRTEGAYTGGNALRKNGDCVVGWVDGHASSESPEALAAGTNWASSPTQTADGALVRTDITKYLWDPNQH